MQVIRTKYNYDYEHDEASLADILLQLAAADSIHNMKEAPELEVGAAHAVQDQLTLLQQMMQQEHNDYEEEAMGVKSDSDSLIERSPRRNSSAGGRSRGKSRGRINSRRRTRHCKRKLNKNGTRMAFCSIFVPIYDWPH